MQNQEIVKIIENLKGRRNYEEKKASKLGFATLYDYLEDKIQQMINLINSKNLPKPNKSCKNCAYARQRSKTDRVGWWRR